MTNHEEMEEQLIETIDEEGNVINFEINKRRRRICI